MKIVYKEILFMSPLTFHLTWFGLSIHKQKAFWISKFAKIKDFWVKYVKTEKSSLKLQKSQILKINKIFLAGFNVGSLDIWPSIYAIYGGTIDFKL